MSTTESRAITLTDLPLLRRLSGRGIVLDAETSATQDTHGVPASHLSSLLFNRGIYTYLARGDHFEAVGQFRYKADDVNAHILALAPGLDEVPEQAWLVLLDRMAREAGKLGAHSLIAEVDARHRLFETFRQARFACYVRQTIWRHDPVNARSLVPLAEETGNDQIGIMSLICHTVPTLQQAVAAPGSESQGLVYRANHQVEAYFALSEGRSGVYIVPYIHPDVQPYAADILESAVARASAASRLPVYVCVRSYQAWMDTTLHRLSFIPVVEQAVMVRQIAAGVRHIAFTRGRLNGKLEPAHRVTPPYWSAYPLDED
jgi:hypothetical protein